MAADAYNVFATAMGNLTTTGSALMKVVGYTQSSLVSLAQRVQSWNGGAKPVFAGTALALLPVLPSDGNYRYSLEDPYVKLGYVPVLNGFDLMILDQFADWTTPFSNLLNDSNVYVISPGVNKLLKVCIEGSTLSNVGGPFDNSNLTQNATFIKNWKVAVATNSVAGLLTTS